MLLQETDLSFIVHAAGVVRNGKGYVFTGRPGSGKSTIAFLSLEDIVLNDEMIIIEKNNDHFFVRSTPFNGSFTCKQEGIAPLKGIYLLKHAKENYLNPLKKIDFIRSFIREIGNPGINPSEKNTNHLKVIEFCEQLFDKTPVYELHFRPDRSFWQCIDEEG